MNKIDEKAIELTALRAELDEIESDAKLYTLADAIREGCQVTTKTSGWGNGERACALTTAVVAARSRNLL